MSEVVVVGGGPAGAMTAATLAGAGREVVVLERDSEPADKVCGDFLSVEAQHALRDVGLDLDRLAPSPIGTVRLMHANLTAEAMLPFRAMGISRRALDAALLDLAAQRGATVRRGVRAQGLRRDGAGLLLSTSDGPLRPDSVFLATGKHELRGAGRPVRAPKWVGFKTYLRLTQVETEALRGAVELVLFDGGYAGLLLVEDAVANLSLALSAERLARNDGSWDGLLGALTAECPMLARRLAGAGLLRARPLAVSGLPYGYVHRPGARDLDGVYRVGDQAAVIPSMTGDGVSMALHTGRFAARSYLERRSAAEHHAAIYRDLRGQMLWASLVQAACLSRTLQPALLRACATVPGIMRIAAALTRVARAGRGAALTPPLSREWRGSQVARPLPEGSGEA